MLPPVDLAHIALEARRLCEDLTQACADANADPQTAAEADAASDAYPQGGLDPGDLCQSLQGVLDALRREDPQADRSDPDLAGYGSAPGSGPGSAPGAPDLGALADHGFELLTRVSALAGRLRLPQHARLVEGLALPLACWVARRGGELSHPAPAVNAAAAWANSLKAPDELATLYGLMSEMLEALSPRLTQDRNALDPNGPWRLLLLNRAIVATRSHRPALMELAFQSVVEALPTVAPDFFREALGQMDALDYPPQVLAVVRRYADAWCTRRTLH
jgi:hypothetical protein